MARKATDKKNYVIVTDNLGFSQRELDEYLKATPESLIFPRLCTASISYDGEPLGEISSEELSDGIEAGRFLPGRLKSAGVIPDDADIIIREALKSTDGEIIVVSTSSYISAATANSLLLATTDLSGEFPERKIRYFDSRATSHGEVLLLKMVDRYEYNFPTEVAFNSISRAIHHRFTEPDLSFAVESGRYAGLTEVMLKGAVRYLKYRKKMPYMYLPYDGKLKIDFTNLHTEKKMMEIWRREYLETRSSWNSHVIVEFAGRREEEMAHRLAEMLEAEGAEAEVQWLSPPIMVHTGPVLAWHCYCNVDR